MADTAPAGERIAKLLARAGIASRREVERMIADGRVALDGRPIETAATILPNLAGVTVDGKPVARPERARLFRFHKPPGLITAERDPAGRPTIYMALRNALPPGTPRLMPVGRLDLNTEGLLLLTNDGGLKRTMELPASGVPRTYRARTFGDITQGRLEDLFDGIEIDGVRYGRIDANMERRTGRNQWIELTLTEGKNREVRRVLEHLGLKVSRLIRTAYGPFPLADLPRGAAQEVRPDDLERFVGSLKLGKPLLATAIPYEGPARPKAPRPKPQAARPQGARSRSDKPRGAKPQGAKPTVGDTARGKPVRPAAKPDRSARPARGSGPSHGNKPAQDTAERPERPKRGAKPAGWARAKPKASPGRSRPPGRGAPRK